MENNVLNIDYSKRLNNESKAIDYEIIQTEQDNNGNLKSAKKYESKKIPKEDSYIKLYLTDVTKLFNLPEGLGKLAVILSSYMTFDGSLFLNSTLKKKISEDLEYKNYRSVDNNLAKLVKAKVLIKNDTGTYEFNPFILAKGKWKDIHSKRKEWAVKIEISYKGDKRIINNRRRRIRIKHKRRKK